jgi:sugar lactone lactonase YvrE
MLRARLAAAVALLLGVTWLATPASAVPDALPSYVLPGDNVFPEGIDVLSGEYYVTSTRTGDVYRGDLGQRRAQVFIRGDLGLFSAIGIKVTAERIIVAGGATGTVSVYDRRTGGLVVRFSNRLSEGTFVNDLSVAPNGDVYATDSSRPVLYRIPAHALNRWQPEVRQLPVFVRFEGTPIRYMEGANLNGIVATPDGQFLVVVQSNTGRLFRIRIADKAVEPVDLGVRRVRSGDGLALTESRVLYVVRNAVERVVEIRMNGTYSAGRVVSSTTDPSFQTPTTAAIAGDRLLVVNSKFDQLPDAPPPFTVSSIPLP